MSFRTKRFRPAGKVSNRALRRQALSQIDHAHKAVVLGERTAMILIAVLAQKGGSVTVTDGTLEQVGAEIAKLDWCVVDGEQPGEHIVKILRPEEQARPRVILEAGRRGGKSAVEIRHIPDEETEANGEPDHV